MLNEYNKAVDETDITSTSDPRTMITKLRIHLLLQEGCDPDQYGDESGFHYLAALAQLELAAVSMKLFELKAENNE